MQSGVYVNQEGITVRYYPGGNSLRTIFGHVGIICRDKYYVYADEQVDTINEHRVAQMLLPEMGVYGSGIDISLPLPKGKTQQEVEKLLQDWRQEHSPKQYSMLNKNCVHVAEALLIKLGYMDKPTGIRRPRSFAELVLDLQTKLLREQRAAGKDQYKLIDLVNIEKDRLDLGMRITPKMQLFMPRMKILKIRQLDALLASDESRTPENLDKLSKVIGGKTGEGLQECSRLLK